MNTSSQHKVGEACTITSGGYICILVNSCMCMSTIVFMCNWVKLVHGSRLHSC